MGSFGAAVDWQSSLDLFVMLLVILSARKLVFLKEKHLAKGWMDCAACFTAVMLQST